MPTGRYTVLKVEEIKNNPTMKELIINLIIVTVAIGGVIGITLWSAEKERVAEIRISQYEECVETKMHTTVIAYYDQHGEYPECSY